MGEWAGARDDYENNRSRQLKITCEGNRFESSQDQLSVQEYRERRRRMRGTVQRIEISSTAINTAQIANGMSCSIRSWKGSSDLI